MPIGTLSTSSTKTTVPTMFIRSPSPVAVLLALQSGATSGSGGSSRTLRPRSRWTSR